MGVYALQLHPLDAMYSICSKKAARLPLLCIFHSVLCCFAVFIGTVDPRVVLGYGEVHRLFVAQLCDPLRPLCDVLPLRRQVTPSLCYRFVCACGLCVLCCGVCVRDWSCLCVCTRVVPLSTLIALPLFFRARALCSSNNAWGYKFTATPTFPPSSVVVVETQDRCTAPLVFGAGPMWLVFPGCCVRCVGALACSSGWLRCIGCRLCCQASLCEGLTVRNRVLVC